MVLAQLRHVAGDEVLHGNVAVDPYFLAVFARLRLVGHGQHRAAHDGPVLWEGVEEGNSETEE